MLKFIYFDLYDRKLEKNEILRIIIPDLIKHLYLKQFIDLFR